MTYDTLIYELIILDRFFLIKSLQSFKSIFKSAYFAMKT